MGQKELKKGKKILTFTNPWWAVDLKKEQALDEKHHMTPPAKNRLAENLSTEKSETVLPVA